MLGKGDCWHGGGLFINDRKFWLNDGYGHTELKTSHKVSRHVTYQPADFYGGECLNVYFNRLQRDGWVLKNADDPNAVLFEKQLPKSWVLRKLAFAANGRHPGRGVYWDAHELRQESNGTVLAFPEWEWADWDRNRLVWAVNGQLRAARLGSGELTGERMLCDFNDLTFKAVAAPY